MSVDETRYYPIDSVSSQIQVKYALSSKELTAQYEQLLTRCIQHCSRQGSLYCGGLGPHVFLRMLLAQYLIKTTTTSTSPAHDNTSISSKIDQAILLLQQAKDAAIYALEHGRRDSRVSLLESPTIGAYCLLAVIDKKLTDHSPQGTHNSSVITSSFSTSWRTLTNHTIQELSTRCLQLAPQECEVLYGRAGALAAIFYLRSELDLPFLGTEFVVKTAIHILRQGRREAQELEDSKSRIVGRLPLVWQWHGKHYLGAAHGVVGILHTLLNLQPQEWEHIERELPNVQAMVKDTIRSLDSLCHVSGNLASSLSEQPVTLRHDRLVHWCHGATGHCLLLIKASHVFQEQTFLHAAQDIAESVLWPRGLLHKGVGLCHGISGNAFVFLALSEALQDTDAFQWQGRALQYTYFALTNLSELENTPDRPYSLYEGMGGLCALLLSCAISLAQDSHGRALQFPLYDF